MLLDMLSRKNITKEKRHKSSFFNFSGNLNGRSPKEAVEPRGIFLAIKANSIILVSSFFAIRACSLSLLWLSPVEMWVSSAQT